jgi:hypothetical protein
MCREFDTSGGKMYTIFWLENLTRREHFEDLDVDGKILEWI